MKKVLLSIFTLLFVAFSMQAQSNLKLEKGVKLQKAPDRNNVLHTNDNVSSTPVRTGPRYIMPEASTRSAQEKEVVIGSTYYDLQTNGSVQARLLVYPDDTKSATWIMSKDAGGATTDRGTGYVHYDGNQWGDDPLARLESLRCGWPGLTTDDNGNEYILSHATATNPYSLNAMSGPTGGSSWTETNLPFDTPTGVLWPRSASSGNYTYAIALTTPTAFNTNGGAIYEGMDGKVLFYRSTDGGASWDLSDVELPGLDSLSYGFINGDDYSITASGNTVAVAIFAGFGDVAVWRSDSNGDMGSWTKTIVRDFPLDGYSIDDLYTFDDIMTPDFDTLTYPDSLAIFSCDGSGAILIDNDGQIHVAFGEMYVQDDVVDGNTSYYPGTSGLAYWNESMGAGNAESLVEVVDSTIDRNHNGIFDNTDLIGFASYFSSLTSYPTLTVDDDGVVYLLYSGTREDMFDDIDDLQFYRHIFATKSSDNGATWEVPCDIINEDTQVFPEFIDRTETVFPYVYPRVIDGKIHLTYQKDFRPGMHSIGDADPTESNTIIYLELSTEYCQTTINTNEPYNPDMAIDVYPNPVNDILTIDLSQLDISSNISLTDITGKQVATLVDQNGVVEMNVETLPNGVYTIKVQNKTGFTSSKVIVAN